MDIIKSKSTSSLETTSALINRAIASNTEITRTHMPKDSSIKRLVRRHRSKTFPSLPKNACDLQLTGQWRLTIDGEDWVVYEQDIEDKKMIMEVIETIVTVDLCFFHI